MPESYLSTGAKYSPQNNPYTMGFDAAVEFAPRVSKNIITKQKMISREEAIETNASFITMDQILKKLTYRPKSSFPRIKCVCPSWDNTPRRGKTGSRIILDSSVSKFAEFYKRAIKETIANDFPADGLLFINAWNEWGEGTHLEPDKKHGYQLLETIKGIMEKTITRLKNDKL